MSAITMNYQEVKMINITAPINNLGYGVASVNIIKSLLKIGYDLQLNVIGQIEDTKYLQLFSKLIQKNVNRSTASVKIWHQNDVHHHIGKGKHIAFPIFELNQFTKAEKWSLSHNDKILVCSEWAKQIAEQETSIETSVVPLGVDRDILKPFKSGRRETVFFNCGKWEVRKGHDILVECFNKAFDYNDEVELWMMCHNPFYSQQQQDEWINLYKNSKLGDKIRIIPRQKDHRDVYNIMKQTDCGVFPARAEGWNLELLEMLSCGKHVITTNYSGHTEFCSVKNSMLVDVTSLESAIDGVWFHGQGMWASIGEDQKDQIISHMREVHKQKKEGDLVQNSDGIITANEFSWENSAKKFVEAIE